LAPAKSPVKLLKHLGPPKPLSSPPAPQVLKKYLPFIRRSNPRPRAHHTTHRRPPPHPRARNAHTVRYRADRKYPHPLKTQTDKSEQFILSSPTLPIFILFYFPNLARSLIFILFFFLLRLPACLCGCLPRSLLLARGGSKFKFVAVPSVADSHAATPILSR
jgi:hypothetical protein